MPTQQPQPTSLVVSVGVQCHVGKERSENQDRVTRAATPFGDLFVVADGVGGYQGGSEAAQATVDGFVRYLQAHGDLSLSDALQQAVRSISADLRQRSAANQPMHGMGSTVVLCVFHGDRITYAHAGDSRLYLLRDHKLTQITRDHSVMERLVSQGVLTPDQAREHPDASVLTRAIGQVDISLDIGELALQPNDGLLLCSDGLWAYARHEEMEAVAASDTLSVSGIATALLNLALEGGGGDNISVQFLRFTTLEWPKKSRSVLGWEHKKAIPVIALASIIAAGGAGMFVSNYRHPIANPNPAATGEASTPPATVQPPPPAPNSATAPEHKPVVPESRPKEKSPAKSSAPEAGHASEHRFDAHRQVDVVIITSGRPVAEWFGRLDDLEYVNTIPQTGSSDCLDLANPAATLFHSAHMAEAARRIAKDLGISASEIKEESAEDLKACGAEIVAMPGQRTLGDRLNDRVQNGVGRAKDSAGAVKSDIDALKKKAQEKLGKPDAPPQTDQPPKSNPQ